MTKTLLFIGLLAIVLVRCKSSNQNRTPLNISDGKGILSKSSFLAFINQPSVASCLYKDVIHQEYNQIYYSKKDLPLKRFYHKLAQLEACEEVKINIAHFGGSHVQAGQLTSYLRQNFNYFSVNARGQRGFIFPSRLVKSNGPDYTKAEFVGEWKSCKSPNSHHQCDWGIAGQSAITKSTFSHIKTWAFDLDSLIYPFQKVRIYRKDNNSAFKIAVNHASCEINSTSEYIDLYFDIEQDTLDIEITKIGQGDFTFELQGFLFQNNYSSGISYHGLGVNGAGINSYLKCNLLEKQLKDIQPDLVIVGLGLNDTYVPETKFDANSTLNEYQQFIDRVRAVNPAVEFVLMTNNDHFFHLKNSNPNSIPFNLIVEKISQRNHLAYWDLFHVMGGANSIKNWEEKGLAKPDLIHFTDQGYRLQANLFYSALMEDYLEAK